MPSKGKLISVDTHPTKHVIVDSLTRDVSVEACIYDLLDNSVDAARETKLKTAEESDQHRLIDSYVGFEIKLAFGSSGFRIQDNCGGIPTDKLQKMVMRFGERSIHELGIGVFGVGLNRALFKLGKVSHLKTDTGASRAELILNTADYILSDKWELPAHEFESIGAVGTEIEIRQPPGDIARLFADPDWVERIRSETGKRYGRFIQKNLRILINNISVANTLPEIMDDGLFDPLNKFLKAEHDIAIIVRCGEHADHKFLKDDEAQREHNKSLGPAYGWTILCNDRTVIIGNKDHKTFWKNWHTEYNGFVGYVNFVGDPQYLPWATSKTDIDLNNGAYQYTRETMEKFALAWRSFTQQRLKGKITEHPLPQPPESAEDRVNVNDAEAAPPDDVEASAPRPTSQKRRSAGRDAAGSRLKSVITLKNDHNDLLGILPADIDETHCFDKHLALVHEAKEINMLDLPYSGMILLRVLFECTTIKFMSRHQEIVALRQFAVCRRGKKVSLTPDEAKKLEPTADEIIAFIQANPSSLHTDNTTQLIQCLQKMATNKKKLNGVVHNAFQTVNRSQDFQMRDDVLPLLRHMIQN